MKLFVNVEELLKSLIVSFILLLDGKFIDSIKSNNLNKTLYYFYNDYYLFLRNCLFHK